MAPCYSEYVNFIEDRDYWLSFDFSMGLRRLTLAVRGAAAATPYHMRPLLRDPSYIPCFVLQWETLRESLALSPAQYMASGSLDAPAGDGTHP
jgi:hypothetical protein